jgi:hypothetical protein
LADVFRAGPGTYAPTFNRVPPPSPQFFTVGGYRQASSKYIDDPSPAISRYMARGMTSAAHGAGSFPSYAPARPWFDAPPSVPRAYVDGPFIRTVSWDYGDYGRRRIYYGSPFLLVSYSSYSYEPVWYPAAHHHHVHHFATPGAMYVIPGCFAGDAPPQRPEKLLPGCKLENLRRVYY